MARTTKQDTERTTRLILDTLISLDGATESELEELTGLQRRNINNYLRAMRDEELVFKMGLKWHANISRKTWVINQIVKLLEELKEN